MEHVSTSDKVFRGFLSDFDWKLKVGFKFAKKIQFYIILSVLQVILESNQASKLNVPLTELQLTTEKGVVMLEINGTELDNLINSIKTALNNIQTNSQ